MMKLKIPSKTSPMQVIVMTIHEEKSYEYLLELGGILEKCKYESTENKNIAETYDSNKFMSRTKVARGI